MNRIIVITSPHYKAYNTISISSIVESKTYYNIMGDNADLYLDKAYTTINHVTSTITYECNDLRIEIICGC